MTTIENKKLDRSTYYKIREEVITTWPTGESFSLEDGVAYQHKIPDTKRVAVY
jgi:glutamate mutase epsilon subunit